MPTAVSPPVSVTAPPFPLSPDYKQVSITAERLLAELHHTAVQPGPHHLSDTVPFHVSRPDGMAREAA